MAWVKCTNAAAAGLFWCLSGTLSYASLSALRKCWSLFVCVRALKLYTSVFEVGSGLPEFFLQLVCMFFKNQSVWAAKEHTTRFVKNHVYSMHFVSTEFCKTINTQFLDCLVWFSCYWEPILCLFCTSGRAMTSEGISASFISLQQGSWCFLIAVAFCPGVGCQKPVWTSGYVCVLSNC